MYIFLIVNVFYISSSQVHMHIYICVCNSVIEQADTYLSFVTLSFLNWLFTPIHHCVNDLFHLMHWMYITTQINKFDI